MHEFEIFLLVLEYLEFFGLWVWSIGEAMKLRGLLSAIKSGIWSTEFSFQKISYPSQPNIRGAVVEMVLLIYTTYNLPKLLLNWLNSK